MRHIFHRHIGSIPLPYCKDSNVLESCIKCVDSPCIDVCEEYIIKKDNSRIYLDFSVKGCTFCKQCAIICEKQGFGILDLSLGDHIVASIEIDQNKCLAWNKTLCSYCSDICPQNSIAFIGGLYPQINTSCNKCGICNSVCPTSCISFKGTKR